MKSTKKIATLVALLFSLSSCMGMTKEYLFSKKDSEEMVVFNVRFNYDGKDREVSQSFRPFFNFRPLFTGSSDYVINQFIINYKVHSDDNGNNYVFMNTNAKEIYFSSLECLQYRVFYNKVRLKIVNKRIVPSVKASKINYGGDIEISWVPEIFRWYDLFLFGHMNLQDRGSFVWKVEDNYESYLKFMKSQYGYDESKSVNSVDKNLVGKVQIDDTLNR